MSKKIMAKKKDKTPGVLILNEMTLSVFKSQRRRPFFGPNTYIYCMCSQIRSHCLKMSGCIHVATVTLGSP